MNQETIEIHLREGNKFELQGELEKAIASYQKALEIAPEVGEAWSKLAHVYYINRNWQACIDSSSKAIALMPDNYQCYKILGWSLKKKRRPEEAIAACAKVIELNPNDSEAYCWLGDIWRLKGNVEEAIATYQKGVEKFPEDLQLKSRLDYLGQEKTLKISEYYEQGMEWVEQKQLEKAIVYYERILANFPAADEKFEKYLSLGIALVKLGKLEEIINCYHRVFQKSVSKIEFYYKFTICLSANELIPEALRFFQEIPKPQGQKNRNEQWEIYDLIWELCNLPDSSNVEISQSKNIDQAAAYEYFSKYKPYQILGSKQGLNKSEKTIINDCGISLEYLELLEKEDRELENIYINSYGKTSPDIIKRKAIVTKKKDRYYKPVEFHQTIVEFKYFYTVDPISGQVLRTNHSFYIPGSNTIIYRFVGKEIFYLIVGGFTGEKVSVYFPKFNISIYLNTIFVGTWVDKYIIHKLQSYMVSNWKYVKNYLADTAEKAVVNIFGNASNLGHYFWQDITGVYYLYENNLLDNVDYFCVGNHEYLKFSSIFPEIPQHKIVKISKMSAEEKFRFFLEKNYICLRIADNFIKENMAERIYQTSRRLCSQEFLDSLEKVKENNKLLLWINVRTHNKSWISQAKGYAQIVNHLKENFPEVNIGIVIDGTPDAASCTEDIISKLKAEIKVYNTLGCPLAESIVWAHYIDAYIATIGSGLVMTSWLTNKPGVAHGDPIHLNQQIFWSDMKENSIPPVFVKNRDIVSQNRMYANYQLNWRVIYNYLVKILKSHSLV